MKLGKKQRPLPNNPTVKRIIKELAEKHQLPKYKIEEIVYSPFSLLAYVLRKEIDPDNGYFPTVGIPFMGKFYVSHYKREKYKNDKENGII